MRPALSLSLAVLALSVAGCGGAEEARPLPETVEGTTPAETGTTTTPAEPAAGDPEAGKAIFAEQGCGACHTYGPAGSSGKIGPDLGNLAADAEEAGRGSLAEYVSESITEPDSYVVQGFSGGIMQPYNLSEQQLSDLVAFLTQGE